MSILVPTYDRPDLVEALLTQLAGQTLDPNQFEVVLVDDGSPVPVQVDASAWPFALQCLRQANAGPGAARNRGLEHCRAPLTLILNDDAVPAPDLCEVHLRAHAEVEGKIAVLGTFPFTAGSLESPFTQILANSDLLFAFPTLRPGEMHDWTYFWTCNLSIPTEALLQVGGFDAERFDQAIVEDVELGYRLQQKGYQVLHRADAICEHNHALTPEGYFRRSVALGKYLARMYEKHGDPAILWCAPGQDLQMDHLQAVQATCEAFHGMVPKLIESLNNLESTCWGKTLTQAEIEPLRALIRKLSYVPFCRGVLKELEGSEPLPVLTDGPTKGGLTSILVVAHDALDQTQRCLAALRAATEPDHPTEFVFIDNGSSDGTAEFLAEQPDVTLIRNTANLGAPKARNQGLAVARGETIVFMDNDVMVTPGWLGRMLFHSQVDGRSGCVGCLSDRAAHKQQLDVQITSDPVALGAFAEERAAAHRRQYRPALLLTSFLLMIRREVLDTIGGFDEVFSPWGFEDDDFSLRAHLAGFRNRVALDVFVRHEPYTATRKQKAHSNLLQRNWVRFVGKWGLPEGTPYGDVRHLAALQPKDFGPADLYLNLANQGRLGDHILAWPDYKDGTAVRSLIQSVAEGLVGQAERQLVLRVAPKVDGPVDEVLRVLEEAYHDLFEADQSLQISILAENNPKRAAEQALQVCGSVSTCGSPQKQSRWLGELGLPPTVVGNL